MVGELVWSNSFRHEEKSITKNLFLLSFTMRRNQGEKVQKYKREHKS